ncbi:hypothetical protein D3C86_1661020 [compost metagenome]
MADACRGMQVDECRVVRGLRVAVRHAHDDRLLQPEHVAEVFRKVDEHRQFRRAGIAEHAGHAERAQQPENRVPHGQGVAGREGRLRGKFDVSIHECS